MRIAIFALSFFAIYLAIMAVVMFIRTCRKPPSARDFERDWLEK